MMNPLPQPVDSLKGDRSARNDLPDHTPLPDKDHNLVKNYQELPQGDLFADCIIPILQQLHPDGRYCIGRDSGIYWRLVELGIWEGEYQNQAWPWLLWWNVQGNLLLTSEEKSELEREQAKQERLRADRLAEQLRTWEVEPAP